MGAQYEGNINQILGLVELAEDKSPEQRKFLYEKISDFLIDDEHSFSVAEKELMADIICRITADVERNIRSNFAKNVASRTDIPKDLMVFLANDTIEVALPVLRESRILEEHDLIKLVHTRSTQHQLAIAARENITEGISQALCDTGSQDVCVSLINNHTAKIAETTLETLCQQSETILAYQKPLLMRPFLPPHIAEKMYRWVSTALRRLISERFEVDPNILQITPEDRAQTILSISEDMDPSEMLVEKLHHAGELSTGFLLKSLRQGEIDLFEISFAKLAGLDRRDLQKLIYADDPKRLAVACKAIGLDKSIFGTILELIISARIPKFTLIGIESESLKKFYGLLKDDAAKRALANADYVSGAIDYSDT
ncbi:DUF2336 domain-containing protein [Sneathiella glossodoripedis]|uniref:DUF2336 domain-containing protein n=1 Tax=Sneathiella glossodoripedis TaxID=418853 RepID=UPI00046F23F0|nr:DUF2336 domain-containing protein [Sneathiella glossodoripedis]